MLVIAPLLVNVVVRAYGWRIILANGPNGVLNWALSAVGLGPVELLYTRLGRGDRLGAGLPADDGAAAHRRASVASIPPSRKPRARSAATSLAVFRRVTLPLSLPGLGAGCTLVFSLTASSFILPALLGGSFTKMLGTLVEEQILTVFDWPFGAAIATVMVVIVMVINLGYMALIERRVRTRADGGELMSETGLGRGAPLIYALTAIIMVFLMLPLILPIVLSVSDTPFVTFPPKGFTLMVRQGPRRAGLHLARSGSASCSSTSAAIGRHAARHADRDRTGAPVLSRQGHRPGIGALAAGLPDAGDRHRAAAAVLLARLARRLPEPRHRPCAGHDAVCGAHRVGEPACMVDPGIEEAARTLGADRMAAFWRVTRPQIMPGLIAGALFAFVTSFDNYAISMWLFDAGHVPLPMMMISLISRMFDPGIAAIASLMIFFSLFMVLLLETLAGLRRAMSF